jgi:hypothetical protein
MLPSVELTAALTTPATIAREFAMREAISRASDKAWPR